MKQKNKIDIFNATHTLLDYNVNDASRQLTP